MLERLQRLGITAADGDLYEFEGKEATPEAFCGRMDTKILDGDFQALLCWERLWTVCLGVHNIDIISGRSRLNIGLQGCDWMEVFPRPPCVSAVKDACEARRKIITPKSRLQSRGRDAAASDEEC